MKMKTLLTAILSILISASSLAQADISGIDSTYHVYVGMDWSGVSAQKYGIDNANASFADIRLGWEPLQWLAIEHRQSIYGGEDEQVKFGLKLGSENIKGDYLKLKHKFTSITGSLSLGRVTLGNYIDFPSYPAQPDVWDQLFALVDPNGVMPDELRKTEPGRYHYKKSGLSYGIGFEGPVGEDRSSWRWSLEYEYVGKIDGWTWSNYYLGFKHYF